MGRRFDSEERVKIQKPSEKKIISLDCDRGVDRERQVPWRMEKVKKGTEEEKGFCKRTMMKPTTKSLWPR